MNNEVTEVLNEESHSKITVSTLLGALKKYVIIIAIAAILVAALAGAYTRIFAKTSYASTADFFVGNVSTSSQTVDVSSLSAAAGVADACVLAIRDDVLVGRIVDEHGLVERLGLDSRDAAIAYLQGGVSAGKSGEDATRFSVYVTTGSEENTLIIMRSLMESLPRELISLYVPDNFDTSFNLRITCRAEQARASAVRSSAITSAIIGGAVALVIAYLVCFFIYINDTKVYDDTTIKAHFTAPVIGIIPEWNVSGQEISSRSKKRAILAGDKRDYKGKLLSATTPFGVTEAFNTLRTNLCYSTAAEKCPVFAVTSDFSGAGKSVISANIAVSLAMLGKKTLLVECDLRRPELSEVFETESGKGLSELLSGVASGTDEVVTSVGVDNLSVVFSGRIPPNPSELLGSETMAGFISKCRETYDIIIIDTPPAYEVSDVGVIAGLLTGTVMVARSHYSDVNAIAASEELIAGVNGRIVGYVVNDVDFKSGSGYRKGKYGYRGYRKYARYYYSSYSTDKKEEGEG